MTIKSHLPVLLVLISACLAKAQQGFLAEYYNGRNFDQLVLTRTDPKIHFVWENVPPAPGMDPHIYSVRWTGKLKAPESGQYFFRAKVDDGIRVKINGQSVIDAWGMHDSEAFSGSIYLQAGQEHLLVVEYFNALLEGEIQLFWQLPSEKPVFQGLLGYNDHPIDPSYIRLPNPPQQERLVSKPTLPAAKPAAPVKTSRLAGFLKRNTRYKLRIEGHTDRIGNAEKNLLLSKERAQTVADYLISKGIAGQRITTIGYGDTRPLVKEAKDVPNEKNRRVEFYLEE
ncbi:MAG: OmpA family protein [Saprospiraceae bacterium]|nr:OmpA family protein [Saprospiraceae bacterium]